MQQHAIAEPGKSTIQYWDLNSSYCHSCKQFLPYANYRWMVESEVKLHNDRDYVLGLKADAPTGYWYHFHHIKLRQEMEDKLRHLPPFPSSRGIGLDELSEHQLNQLDKHKLTHDPTRKLLVMDLKEKKDYSCHYLTLQFWLQQDAIESFSISRVLSFSQAPIFRDFANKVSTLRQSLERADGKRIKKFANGLVGRLSMDKAKRSSNTVVIHDEVALFKYSDRMTAPLQFIDGSESVIATVAKSEVVDDRPCLISATVHEFGRLNVARKWAMLQGVFGDRITYEYGDTDSLICHVQTECWESEVHAAGKQAEFDWSNYPKKSVWYKPHSETGQIKSETAQLPIESFYSTGSKSHLSSVFGGGTKQAQSGVVELRTESVYADSIAADAGVLLPAVDGTRRVILSCFDSKMFQCEDGSCYPHGHSKGRRASKAQEVDAQILDVHEMLA